VHDKQTSKFDIINLKPREYNQDIKQYPWLTVENRDDVYYRRMNEVYNNSQPEQQRAKTMERPAAGVVAGRHTYDLEPKVSIDPENGSGKYFSPKMLNHMDELQHNLA
jgi:phosphomannomutase